MHEATRRDQSRFAAGTITVGEDYINFAPEALDDPVSHPTHYTSHPSGVECLQITEHMNFCLGNAMKYIWRAGLKNENPIEDLKKAAFYVNREIERLTKAGVGL